MHTVIPPCGKKVFSKEKATVCTNTARESHTEMY